VKLTQERILLRYWRSKIGRQEPTIIRLIGLLADERNIDLRRTVIKALAVGRQMDTIEAR
jgi:hypothetical protein